MVQGVSRQRTANGYEVLRWRFGWNGTARGKQEMPAACEFYSPFHLFTYLFGRTILERGFLAYTTHDSLA